MINYGQINIEGNPSHTTEYGIFNNGGTVINEQFGSVISAGDVTGEIEISGATVINNAIENVGTFTNDRIIMIEGHNGDGIKVTEEGTFNNNNNGSVNIIGGNTGITIIDDVSFVNSGRITIENSSNRGIGASNQGEFTNNNLVNIIGGNNGLKTDDSVNFTNRGILNIDGAIRGVSLSGFEFINDIDGEININQRFEETTSVGIVVFSEIFENMGGTIRIGGLKRREEGDITRAIQVSNNSSFTNSQGGLIYIDTIPTNISDAIALFENTNFFNDRCSGIINSSIYKFRYDNDGGNPTFGNNGWIISYANDDNSITNNNIGTIINFGNGAFNIANGANIPANNDPTITQEIFCNGTENIQFSSYLGTSALDFAMT